jgi:hypothetical protein
MTNEILQDLAHMTDRQRIVSGVINKTRFTVGQTFSDPFGEMN